MVNFFIHRLDLWGKVLAAGTLLRWQLCEGYCGNQLFEEPGPAPWRWLCAFKDHFLGKLLRFRHPRLADGFTVSAQDDSEAQFRDDTLRAGQTNGELASLLCIFESIALFKTLHL